MLVRWQIIRATLSGFNVIDNDHGGFLQNKRKMMPPPDLIKARINIAGMVRASIAGVVTQGPTPCVVFTNSRRNGRPSRRSMNIAK